jgi:hypothetical protein
MGFSRITMLENQFKHSFGRSSRSEVGQKWRSCLRAGICKNGEAVPNLFPASCMLRGVHD